MTRPTPARSPAAAILWFVVGFAAVACLFTELAFGYWVPGFFLLMVGSALVALSGYAVVSSQFKGPVTRLGYTDATFNILVALLALVGLLAMFYDRIAIRGIDYLHLGMAAARAEFNSVGERGGTISIFGNLFSAAVYLPLINLFYDWERWGRGRVLVLILVVVDLLGLTYITGGRTALLIAIALAAAAVLGRGAFGIRLLPSFLTVDRLAVGAAGVCVLFGAVFALRATAFGAADSADYLAQLCFHLSQPATKIMVQCSSIASATGVGPVDEVINYGMGVLLYAFHVAWVGDSVIASVNPGAFTTFAGLQDMFLGRFGFQMVATDYDGYFIPGAASLVYDFGYVEMVIGFLVMGLAVGVFRNAMLRGGIFWGRIPFCFAAGGLMLSVLISPANLPILILSIMSIGVIAITIGALDILRVLPARASIRKLQRLEADRDCAPL